MKNLVISIFALFVLTGCNFFSKTSELTIEQKEAIVKSAARTATVIAIREGFKNNPTKQNEVALLIAQTIVKDVLPVVEGQSMPVVDFVSLLQDKLAPEYILAVQTAFDILTIYYPLPTEPLFDEHSKRLLVAFLSGIVDGSRFVVNLNNPTA